MSAPFALFVPSYGGGGTGEFVRSVNLALALQRRMPAARIEFLLPGGAGTRQDAPFPKVCHSGPPSEKDSFDRQHIERLRPDVVMFDSGCRSSTMRLCKKLGITTAYYSNRYGTCRKAFRPDWLYTLDYHWHQREHLTAPAFTVRQRLLARISTTQRVIFDTCFPDWHDETGLDAEAQARLQQPFVLFAPGGGGYRIDGRNVAEIYLEAAERLHAATGIECLTLTGTFYEATAPSAGAATLVRREVSQSCFVDLLRRAAIVVANGGQIVHQAMTAGAACICAPLGGADQQARIDAYAARRWLMPALPQARALSAAAAQLVRNPAERAALRDRVAALQLCNGIPIMAETLARVLTERG